MAAMESKLVGRFTLGKQSSLMPRHEDSVEDLSEMNMSAEEEDEEIPEIPGGIQLMYSANEGDVEGIDELLKSGVDVNFRDVDGRTALHVAACQGFADVVELLLRNGAKLDPKDRWGSTPLADAIHYKHNSVIVLLENRGAKMQVAPMLVKSSYEVPEYEINPSELDFTNSVDITKGTFRVTVWRGIQVAVKKLGDELVANEEKVRAFRDELALLQQLRHPNVVQFLGAVTQSTPMMIVTEYLPKGDLREYLRRKGALRPDHAVRLALDIARGMNYLHEHKPEAVIHCDLEPSNILRDDSGHLKVADFGVSKFLKKSTSIREDRPLSCQDTSCRYVAPEVFLRKEYDTKVDVFSFALILQEMIEGCIPFSATSEIDVPNSYASKQRPPFKASPKLYAHGLRELIEDCWHEDPSKRPTFRLIISRLSTIQNHLAHKKRWKNDRSSGVVRCCGFF
ncbi:integrin-linked protein kinase family isoform X2 [Wolffia australiana]